MLRRKTLPEPGEQVITVRPSQTLDELESDISDAVDEFMDPANRRILLFPMKPWRKSQLQAVEFGTLCQQLQSQTRRVNFHPLDANLPLTEEIVSEYYLDVELMKRRDAWLERHGHSLRDLLSFRGITPVEYQKLQDFFQKRWRYRLANYGLLSLIAAGGVAGFIYNPLPQGVMCFSENPNELAGLDRMLRGSLATVSVVSTAGLSSAWKRRDQTMRNTVWIAGVSLAASLWLVEGVMLESGCYGAPGLEKDVNLIFALPFLSIAKVAIPLLQNGLFALGKSTLRSFSIFAREPDLLKTYADRPPLPQDAEAKALPAPGSEPPRRRGCFSRFSSWGM